MPRGCVKMPSLSSLFTDKYSHSSREALISCYQVHTITINSWRSVYLHNLVHASVSCHVHAISVYIRCCCLVLYSSISQSYASSREPPAVVQACNYVLCFGRLVLISISCDLDVRTEMTFQHEKLLGMALRMFFSPLGYCNSPNDLRRTGRMILRDLLL